MSPVSPRSSGISVPQSPVREESLSGVAPTVVPQPGSVTGSQSSSAQEATVDKAKPISDKEREKLLYPGRVLLTSKSRCTPFSKGSLASLRFGSKLVACR